jgi:hypothetical protein
VEVPLGGQRFREWGDAILEWEGCVSFGEVGGAGRMFRARGMAKTANVPRMVEE